MAVIARRLKYEDVKNKKSFRIEPSRQGTRKPIDPEQMRIFAERQKRLAALWRGMGIVSWRVTDRAEAPEPESVLPSSC